MALADTLFLRLLTFRNDSKDTISSESTHDFLSAYILQSFAEGKTSRHLYERQFPTRSSDVNSEDDTQK